MKMNDFMKLTIDLFKINEENFKEISIGIDCLLENGKIDNYEYNYLLGLINGIICTKIKYNLGDNIKWNS